MASVEMTKENFNEIIKNNETVLIDLWASWCGPCKMFGPIFEEVSNSYPDIVFAKVNTEEQPELAQQFGANSIPTLAIMRDEVMLFNQAGMVPKEGLDNLIEQVQGLDMDQVRKEIAEKQAEENKA